MTTGELIIIGLLSLCILLLIILMIRHGMKTAEPKAYMTFYHKKSLLNPPIEEDLGDAPESVIPYMSDEQRHKQALGEDALIHAEDDYDERHNIQYPSVPDPWNEPVRRYSSKY